ncbi:MAG: metallophosphoesterase [Merismopedia sp. SIO2A8]|nr:metallophosphoesterase [Merismopedia sp. SIO2A8]
MSLNFRFAIASDLHIGLPHTIPDNPFRFHRIEISIPNYEYVINQLRQLDLDFLLIPGDLTQDGEPDNHEWLSHALAQLPFPVYVIPGNHDAKQQDRTETSIGIAEFPTYYQKFGYRNPAQLYYTCTPLPGLRLIGLNSVFFEPNGEQRYTGRLDQPQLEWLQQTLAEAEAEGDRVFVMVHHNVLEHLPNQSKIRLGQRYMLENAPELVKILQDYGVQLVFTGHLHVQDVACQTHGRKRLYDICTGSLVSYPHAYRILHYREPDDGNAQLTLESRRIHSAPEWPDLQTLSREFMSDRSPYFIRRLLTSPPLNLSEQEAEPLLPHLRYFWSTIADGDAQFDFSPLPKPVQTYFEAFNARDHWDNNAVLEL